MSNNEIEILSPTSQYIEVYDEDVTKKQIIENDLEQVKDNINNLISNGQTVLDNLGDLATQSQDVDFYDTYAKMMKTMLDAQKALSENIKQRKDNIVRGSEDSSANKKNGTYIQNNTFVGTTDEALKMARKNSGNNE